MSWVRMRTLTDRINRVLVENETVRTTLETVAHDLLVESGDFLAPSTAEELGVTLGVFSKNDYVVDRAMEPTHFWRCARCSRLFLSRPEPGTESEGVVWRRDDYVGWRIDELNTLGIPALCCPHCGGRDAQGVPARPFGA